MVPPYSLFPLNKPGKRVSQVALVIKNPPANAGDTRDSLIAGSGRSPGGGNGTDSRILAWKIPWTEKPGELHTVHGVAKELDVTG